MKFHSLLASLMASALIAASPNPAEAASCDGDWSVTLDRTVRGGKSEPYHGKLTVTDGRYSLKAQADIYVMVSEGPITDCKLSGAKLAFTNRTSSYSLDLDLSGPQGVGTWYDTTFNKPVTAKR